MAVESTMPNDIVMTSGPRTNGGKIPTVSRANETIDLLEPILSQLKAYLQNADLELDAHRNKDSLPESGTSLVPDVSLYPSKLRSEIQTSLALGEDGVGRTGLLKTVDDILRYSVNTTAPGFLDKLYASPLPPGVAAELILSVLNTNLHVYHVSPVLTLIEQRTTKALASMFGFNGPRAGGISVQGGSASNLTSVVVARNTLFPDTKTGGNDAPGHSGKLILFTSSHGHYSTGKAAQALGMGSDNVVSVPVDDDGAMIATELERLILETKQAGHTPFYVSATAGTTVFGSFDPFKAIADVAKRYRCWFHVDGAWGGSFIFSNRKDILSRLEGIERADSIAVNPHKMLGAPVTCSFLLTRDLRLFEASNSLKAGYLFHDVEEDTEEVGQDDETAEIKDVPSSSPDTNLFDTRDDDSAWVEPDDLADITLQCGRRGDSLKFFLSWQYYGTSGYRNKVDGAYKIALHLSHIIDQHDDLQLVLGKGSIPQCLQLCFYYTPGGRYVFGTSDSSGLLQIPESERKKASSSPFNLKKLSGKYNTIVTSRVAKELVSRGFMCDFAPASEGQEDRGSFFRLVVNISTIVETVERLVSELLMAGAKVTDDLKGSYRSVDD